MAFVWGIWCVIINLYYPRRFVEETVIFSVDRSDWTFGQIVSVTLLAAPLITIIEYFDHGKFQPVSRMLALMVTLL